MTGRQLWALFDAYNQKYFGGRLQPYAVHTRVKLADRDPLGFCDWIRRIITIQRGLSDTESPDAMFALTDPAKLEGKNTLYYFLEMERAKIGHDLNGDPSIMRKLGKYYAYYGTDKCEKEWPDFRQFRVIVVQRTEERR
jgi:hypothetical protein